MKGLSILLGFTLLGYLIRSVLDIPVAGNVIGLILLVISLFAGWVKLEWVEDTAQFLLRHMMIFFLPPSLSVRCCSSGESARNGYPLRQA